MNPLAPVTSTLTSGRLFNVHASSETKRVHGGGEVSAPSSCQGQVSSLTVGKLDRRRRKHFPEGDAFVAHWSGACRLSCSFGGLVRRDHDGGGLRSGVSVRVDGGAADRSATNGGVAAGAIDLGRGHAPFAGAAMVLAVAIELLVRGPRRLHRVCDHRCVRDVFVPGRVCVSGGGGLRSRKRSVWVDVRQSAASITRLRIMLSRLRSGEVT